MGKVLARMVWEGEPRTKKNSGRIVKIQKGERERSALLPSKAYEIYERKALLQIHEKLRLRIRSRVNLRVSYFMGSARVVDLAGLEQATADILVKGKVLEDDRCSIVAGWDGSRVFIDRDRPRAEICIEEMDGECDTGDLRSAR